MQNRTIVVLFLLSAISLGVLGGRVISKETLITEVTDLKKLIDDTLQKLHDLGLQDQGDTLKRYERDVSVVEKHIEQAGDDVVAIRSASIVLGGLTKKIHDEAKRCNQLLHHNHS